jgi:hypothetical protein
MQTKLNLRRGIAVLALAAALMTLAVASTAAKPKHAFAPKAGTYTGDSFAEGKTHAVSAKVTRKGSKYSAEIEIAVPAVCEDTETHFKNPTELLFKVTAPVKGHSISFKGDALDAMQIVGGTPSGISLNGKFTKSSTFTATVGVKAPAEDTQSVIHCSVPTTQLKFQFALAPL